MPAGGPIEKTDTDVAFYILSRVAGEGADRYDKEGDYYLTETEKKQLSDICSLYKHVVVAVNTGGLADLSFMDEFSNIEALLQTVQPGMEGGNAFADIVSGAATPSGKLTDSCADEKVEIETETANVGNTYSGKEVVQIYVTCPAGTLLAQSWNEKLIEELGEMIGGEMEEFHVTLWLAPGMNIHRNPLYGRNFEYYSEDPFLSGKMAAAMTKGVQKVPGCGTTIKHYACNNQEDNRMGSNSILSERTLREIYLKGFEIAIKESQPMSIMTSYNLINGVHAANCNDTCTKAARCEWGFKGMIMTDWTTTEHGSDCTASGCMRAGNDLVMPGAASDRENIKKELDEGTLSLDDLKACISRTVDIIWQSNQYEGAVPYKK